MRLAVSPLGGWHRTTAIANSSNGPRKLQLPGRGRIPPCSFFTPCHPEHRYFRPSDSARVFRQARHFEFGLRSVALLMPPFVGFERLPNHRASPLSPTHRLGTSSPWFPRFFSTKSSLRRAGKKAALGRYVEGLAAHIEGTAESPASSRGAIEWISDQVQTALVTVYPDYDLRVSGNETHALMRAL
jgi:hypothetical protein